ncbi:ATP-binding protein [Membranicola marinus]|uniref:ATP-binding protein n=1 Tax=Membranihabitans marinus TaxID=1227546 RepID=A0A953LDX8_9BACT|nr:ATP-binding protein [Membranihabitans marinus]MBY5959354.1 ATP-binding protein [Membranihabitans marinus]
MIYRKLTGVLRGYTSMYPILTITGPRQSGKTTLLKNIFPDYKYLSLENPNIRAYAENDPVAFLKEFDHHVILDEVQQVPSLFSYLQTIVDESRQMGQYILSGSQNFHLLEGITQSLAGRTALFKLLPFDSSELNSADLLPEDWKSLLIKGFYPAVYDRDLDPAGFYNSYIQTYIDRDVTALTNIQDLRRFRNFIGLCATRNGQLLNLSHLANESGISQPTAKSWLSILESSYIVFLLQPYFENFGKRIRKAPKLYFYDVGLVAHLLGLREVNDLEDRKLIGSLFENLVVSDLMKRNHHDYLLRDYYFWRDSEGHEVDLLYKQGPKFNIFEIKSTQTILPKHFQGLDYFEKLVKGNISKPTLIYGGSENQERTKYRVRSWRG